MRINQWPLQAEADPDTAAGGTGKDAQSDADLGSVEDRARRMGWVPAEEFRGDKKNWHEATVFVKNAEESLPLLRAQLKALERQNIDLSKSVGEFKQMSDTAFDRAYAKAKKELQTEIKTAAKAGDDKAVDAATDELADLEGEKAKRKAAADKDPVFDGWLAQNAWYNDAELQPEAEAIAFKLRRKGDKTEGLAFLDKVKEEMKKQFPEKFGNPRRQQPGGTERPAAGGDGGERGSKKGWDSLPSEAKESGERYIKQKLFKDKAGYADAYWAQQ